MVSDSSELPFLPQYETEFVSDEKIRITWFEQHFSQSYYNVNNTCNGSNACTLIAVIMASKCHQCNTCINGPNKPLNNQLINHLAVSMIEGNRIYEILKTKNMLKHVNLNVPEAIKYAGVHAEGLTEWKGLVYMEPLSESLFENIKINWIEWIKTSKKHYNKDMYIMLVADSRTVLFYIQNQSDTITLVDSHQHSSTKGAFIASSQRQRLKLLCSWFCGLLAKVYKSNPQLYELSFLYFKTKDK